MTKAPESQPHKGWHSRGYQPHCDYPGLIQSIGIRLCDSVPTEVVDRWKRQLKHLDDEQRRRKLCNRIDRYADRGYGECHLANEAIARLVENAFLHFDEQRYDLLAWCVMPNHAHILVVPRPGHSLSGILQSWKSYTAHEANKILTRKGKFWFPDYFDEYMKSTAQYEATIIYIELNPVTAKLVRKPEDCRFSSAATHHVERVLRNRSRFPEIDPEQLP